VKEHSMNKKSTEQWADAVALDRYSVIAPLIARKMSREERIREYRQVVNTVHKFESNGREIKVDRRTVERWVSWYRYGHKTKSGVVTSEPGLEALRPMRRADCGLARALSDDIVERALRLRREEPTRTTATLIALIESEHAGRGEEMPAINEHTLSRHLRAKGGSRRALRREGRAYPRYEHAYRNAVWHYAESPIMPICPPVPDSFGLARVFHSA
jgi:hypothetical protein